MTLPPINPKKRALMPSGPLRKTLRAAGHELTPVVQLGKTGVTPAVLAQMSTALDHHELIKIKIGAECPDDRFTVADACAEVPRAHVAQVLGRTVLVYRRHAKEPKFEPSSEVKSDSPLKTKARTKSKAAPRRKKA